MRAIMSKMLELYGVSQCVSSDRMQTLCQHLLEFLVFDERIIQNEPIERWPLCDCLISFYATDFPLAKAAAYAELRKPYIINDLRAQYNLLSRVKIYSKLKEKNIETPRHVVLDRTDRALWYFCMYKLSRATYSESHLCRARRLNRGKRRRNSEAVRREASLRRRSQHTHLLPVIGRWRQAASVQKGL